MTLRFLGSVIAALVVFTFSSVHAQQARKIPVLGYLSGFKNAGKSGSIDEPFWRGLWERGYTEGKNIQVETRLLAGIPDVYPKLIGELVGLKVDVLVIAGSFTAIKLARQATKTIPIVFITTQDPVQAGFVESLARPGGNITGVTTLLRELSGKRLEVFKEAVPGLARVAALVSVVQLGQGPSGNNDFRWYETPGRALNLQLQPIGLQPQSPDIEGAFQTAAKAKANGLITVSGGIFTPHLKRIADLAIKYRLPSMHERIDYVEAGGLMYYAASDAASYRRAADYVDRILKGTKPADLPVEQPTKFDFVVNLKAAKQIGLTIPPEVLGRATRITR